MKTTASEAVLFIFQLPTMRGLRTGVSMLDGGRGYELSDGRLHDSIWEGGQAWKSFAFQ